MIMYSRSNSSIVKVFNSYDKTFDKFLEYGEVLK